MLGCSDLDADAGCRPNPERQTCKWATELSAEMRARVKADCGQALRLYGYQAACKIEHSNSTGARSLRKNTTILSKSARAGADRARSANSGEGHGGDMATHRTSDTSISGKKSNASRRSRKDYASGRLRRGFGQAASRLFR